MVHGSLHSNNKRVHLTAFTNTNQLPNPVIQTTMQPASKICGL